MVVGELGKLMARGALLFWGYTRVEWVRTDVSPHAHVKGNLPADAAVPTNGAPHAGVPGRCSCAVTCACDIAWAYWFCSTMWAASTTLESRACSGTRLA